MRTMPPKPCAAPVAALPSPCPIKLGSLFVVPVAGFIREAPVTISHTPSKCRWCLLRYRTPDQLHFTIRLLSRPIPYRSSCRRTRCTLSTAPLRARGPLRVIGLRLLLAAKVLPHSAADVRQSTGAKSRALYGVPAPIDSLAAHIPNLAARSVPCRPAPGRSPVHGFGMASTLYPVPASSKRLPITSLNRSSPTCPSSALSFRLASRGVPLSLRNPPHP